MSSSKTLRNYIISCHVDKPLTQAPPPSVFDCPIQAGAALTDVRICELNDMDDCPDNISALNRRLCEATAMYWIGKHIETDYVGIMHYRRRMDLTDADYIRLMDEGVDIITIKPLNIWVSIEEDYRKVLYSRDFDLFLDILKRNDGPNYDFYRECFTRSEIHACNVNVFKAELYREFCEWAFPICFEFAEKSPEKTDVYQHRDAAFIMERLSDLFVMRKKRDGFHIEEAALVDIRSKDWEPENACNMSDYNEVYNTCDHFYRLNQIIKCNNVLGVALRNGAGEDERLSNLSELLIASILERMELPLSMHEYLPEEFRSNIGILIDVWKGFKTIARLHHENGNEETLSKLTDFISLTHFSRIALREAINASYRNDRGLNDDA